MNARRCTVEFWSAESGVCTHNTRGVSDHAVHAIVGGTSILADASMRTEQCMFYNFDTTRNVQM